MNAYDALLMTVAVRLSSPDTNMPAKVRDAHMCPSALLPHLAWSRGLDYWSASWLEPTKRELILQTPANMRRRGTRAAIDAAVRAFETEIEIVEWWEASPTGAPGTASATVQADTAIGLEPGGQETLQTILEREGRASLHWTVRVVEQARAGLRAKGVARVGVLLRFDGVQRGA